MEYLVTFAIPLSLYTFVMCVTPGPNNAYLMSAGSIFSYRRCLPYMMGCLASTPLVYLLVGLGLGGIFERYPAVYLIFKIAGTLLITYIAWKIYTTPVKSLKSGPEGQPPAKPIGFLPSFLFNVTNIKIWACGVAGIATYIPHNEDYYNRLIFFIVVSIFMGWLGMTAWNMGGHLIGRLKPEKVAIINKVLAVCLFLTVFSLYF